MAIDNSIAFLPCFLLAERRGRVQGLHDQRPGEPALHHVRPRPGLQLGIYSRAGSPGMHTTGVDVPSQHVYVAPSL